MIRIKFFERCLIRFKLVLSSFNKISLVLCSFSIPVVLINRGKYLSKIKIFKNSQKFKKSARKSLLCTFEKSRISFFEFRNFIFDKFSQLSNSFSKFKFRFPKFHIMESVIKCHWIWCSFCSYSDIGVFIEIHFNHLFQTFY